MGRDCTLEYSSGIYQIRNKITNHIYIGSSSTLSKRKSHHFSDLKKNVHKNGHLQSAYNKYGKENFIFEILIPCDPSLLIWYEQQFIDQWKPEYNKRKKAESNAGLKRRPCSEETKEKIRQAQIGKPRGSMSEENKLKISLSNKGRIKSPEWCANLTKAQTGKRYSEESRLKMRNSHLGKKLSEEQKYKISQSMKLYRLTI